MSKKTVLFLLWVVFALAALVFGSQSRVFHGTSADLVGGESPRMDIVQTGDTAAVLKFTPGAAIDSFAYLCTLIVNTDDSAAILWTSHPQRQRLTPSTVWDADRTVLCSVVFPGATLGCATLDPGATYTTGAKMVDTLTYIINNTTGIKDSILAVDSGTYVKLIDKNTQVYRTGRWTLKIAYSGGATSALDTLTNAQRITAGYITTAAMICDSMVAKINATAACTAYVTAYDSTTFWIDQSDDIGLNFEADIPNIDTTADTVRSIPNKASNSRTVDTILLANMIFNDIRFTGVDGTIILDTIQATTQGINLTDSGYLILYGSRYVRGSLVLDEICRDSTADLPCTLSLRYPALDAYDTLFGEQLWIVYAIMDSASDTTGSFAFSLFVDMTLFAK